MKDNINDFEFSAPHNLKSNLGKKYFNNLLKEEKQMIKDAKKIFDKINYYDKLCNGQFLSNQNTNLKTRKICNNIFDSQKNMIADYNIIIDKLKIIQDDIIDVKSRDDNMYLNFEKDINLLESEINIIKDKLLKNGSDLALVNCSKSKPICKHLYNIYSASKEKNIKNDNHIKNTIVDKYNIAICIKRKFSTLIYDCYSIKQILNDNIKIDGNDKYVIQVPIDNVDMDKIISDEWVMLSINRIYIQIIHSKMV